MCRGSFSNHELADAMQRWQRRNALSSISPAGLAHLREIYSAVWTEANYDPYNADTEKFAKRLLPHIQALNEELKFKA